MVLIPGAGRTGPAVPVLGAVGVMVVLLGGCSGSSRSEPVGSRSEPVGSRSEPVGSRSEPVGETGKQVSGAVQAPHAAASLSTEVARAAVVARQDGRATCTSLPVSRVRDLLGAAVADGVKDKRKSSPAQTQLDGCSYTTATGTRLSYLVWQLAEVPTQKLVGEALPPEQSGARPFSVKVGSLSAAAVVVHGPIAVAQVNAVRGKRFVQVTVTVKDVPDAKASATSAAKALL